MSDNARSQAVPDEGAASPRFDGFDDVHDLGELFGLAIGAGSVCWENPADAGVFDSTRAAAIADAAFQRAQVILAGLFSGVSR